MKKWLVAGASLALALTACGGSSGGSGKNSTFCKKAASYNEADVSKALTTAKSPSDLKKAFEDAVAKAKDVANSAPSALKSDFSTLVKALDNMASALKKNNYDIVKASTDPALTALTDDAAIQKASDNVDKYLKDTCGIDTGSSSSDTTAPSSKDTSGASDTTGTKDTTAGKVTLPANIDTQIAAMRQFFPKLSDDQIKCLLQKGMDVANGGAQPDASILADCNITLDQLTGA